MNFESPKAWLILKLCTKNLFRNILVQSFLMCRISILPFGRVHTFSEIGSLHSPSEPQALASTVYCRAASSSVRSHFKELPIAAASQKLSLEFTLYTVIPVVMELGVIVTTIEVGNLGLTWIFAGAARGGGNVKFRLTITRP